MTMMMVMMVVVVTMMMMMELIQVDDLMVALESEKSKCAAIEKKQKKFDQMLAEKEAIAEK